MWTRLGGQLSPDSVIENGILRIDRILQTDAGDYQCHARNRVGDDSRILRIYVRPRETQTRPPPPPPPSQEVVIQPPSFTGRPGDDVVLTCRNVINVYATLIWSKQGTPELPAHIYLDNGVLTIQRAVVEDSGRYVCTSHDQQGYSHTEIADVFITPTSDHRQPPTIRPLQELYNILQGQEFSLVCDASGNPYPNVKWTRVHDPLGPNVQQNGNTLRILNAQIADRGVYLCTAESDGVITEASTIIEVERKYFTEIKLKCKKPRPVNYKT